MNDQMDFDPKYSTLRRIENLESSILDVERRLSSVTERSSQLEEIKNKIEVIRVHINELKLEVQNNTLVANITKWLATAVFGTLIAILLSLIGNKVL